MKKYLSVLTVAALAACATSAFGQGILTFANNNASLVKQWGDATGSTLINVPSGGGQVSLFWAAANTAYTPWTTSMTGAAFLAANPGWKQEAAAGFNPLAAGRFNAGNLTLSPLTTISAGVDYVVMGWTGTAGFDAAIAAGGMVNVSGKFHTAVGDGSAVPPGAPVALTATFTGVTLQPVTVIPEPSTFALAGLGAAALLIFRRRK
jgi:hypothetical protein